MPPVLKNYTAAEIEQMRKDIAATSPEVIEQRYRRGEIGLADKLNRLQKYGEKKREIQIRDMSMAGDGGALGEVWTTAIGVAREGEKAWQAATKLFSQEEMSPADIAKGIAKGQPPKGKGQLAGEAAFHTLMAGLEVLKAYDIPGNVIERKLLESGIDPGFARAANWAAWIPSNFFGISQALRLPFKGAGAGIKAAKNTSVGQATSKYFKWLQDPVGEATKSALKLSDAEKAKVLGAVDDAILQTETGQALKKVADAVTTAESKFGVTPTKAAKPAAAEAREGLEGFIADDIIPTPEEFEKGAISQLIKFYEQKAQKFIRKGVSHEVTEAQAVGKMSFEELLNRPPEMAASNAEIAYMGRVNDAIRRGLESTIEDALPHLDDIMAGNRPDLTGLFRAYFSAFAQTNPTFLGASGELGRGLEFMKVLQPEVKAARIYDTVLQGLAGDVLAESSDAAIAKSLLKLSVLEKSARKAFLEGVSNAESPRLANSLFKSLLFVVPSTHMANLAGQNQGGVLQMLQYSGSALVGGGEASIQSAFAMWKGFGSAWLHLPRIMRIASERSATSLDKLGLEGATDAVARYGPARWLGFGDELVSAALEQGYVNAYAIEQGVAKGLKGKALADFANNIKLTSVKELEERAQPIVQHAMFHDPLGPLAAPIQRMAHDTFVDFWLPVVKFPINSLKAARDWTPGLQFMSGKFMDDLAAGGAREAEARTRTTLSWMFANYLWGEAKAGNFTGGGPQDLEKNKAWQAAGNVPYSFRGLPYRWFEPIGTMMGGVADMAYFSNQMEPDDVEDYSGAIAMTLGRMFQNNWWLRSMEGVTSVISGAREAQGMNEQLMNAARFALAPAITVATGGPLGGRVREILDPEIKQLNSFSDFYLAKTPGASKYVPPLLNYSGKPKHIPPVMGHRWLNLVLPSGLRGSATDDPVGAFMHKHGLELPDNWKTLGSGASGNRPFFEPGQGKIVPTLDAKESHNWKLLSLDGVKNFADMKDGSPVHLTWVEQVAALDQDPYFLSLNRYDKQRMLSAYYGAYRNYGEQALIDRDPVVKAKAERAEQRTLETRGQLPADFGKDMDALPPEQDATPDAPEQPPRIIEAIEQPAVEAPVQ